MHGHFMNDEWIMNLYSSLLCIIVHPKCFKIVGGGGGVSPQPPVWSIHLDDATAATGQWRQCAHHTPATGGEERESHRANQVDGDYWEARIDKGQWWDTGVTPLLFTRSALGFLITTESQDHGLMSHPKDGQKIYVSIIKPNFFCVCVCVLDYICTEDYNHLDPKTSLFVSITQ